MYAAHPHTFAFICPDTGLDATKLRSFYVKSKEMSKKNTQKQKKAPEHRVI